MADKETVIGPETRVSGEVRGDEDLLVRGRIDGSIQLSAVLTVDSGAIVQADVQARAVIVSGTLLGSVTASESVRLSDKARVIGDITAPRVVIEAGAGYRGRIEMGEVDLNKVSETRASARRSSEKEGKAPPRIASPARVASVSTVAARVATAPARATSAPASAPERPAAPPSLPRPVIATAGGVASAPAWAKKKLRRR